MNLFEKCQRLFCRMPNGFGYRGNLDSYATFMEAFAAGDASIRMVRIPRSCVVLASAITYPTNSRETYQHQFLKQVGLEWMLAEHAIDAEPEAGFHGFRLDVYSRWAGWAIEVGHSDASKFVSLALKCDLRRMTVIPFRREIGGPMVAVDISFTDEWRDRIWATREANMRKAGIFLEIGGKS